MLKDRKMRTVSKTITWRITATLTTIGLVWLFTGRLETAIEVGILEWMAKMLFYYIHERSWDHIKWGKVQLPSFVLWINGIPRSGKTTLGNMVAEELTKIELPIQRLDSHDVRPLFPETGFTREEVNNHIKRVGHLASMLEKNGVSPITSFVAPYRESREFVKSISRNFVEVYLKTTAESAKKYDDHHLYERAEKGEIKNFPGVDTPFEESEEANLVLDVSQMDLIEAKNQIMQYLRKRFLKE
jgi:adenylylsulfate kinase